MEQHVEPARRATITTLGWTLTETLLGFRIAFHPAPSRRLRLLRTAPPLCMTAAAGFVGYDIVRAHGAPIGPALYTLVFVASTVFTNLKPIWRPKERLRFSERHVEHTWWGRRVLETRSMYLGACVEIEIEPTYEDLWARLKLTAPLPIVTLHSNGRTLRIGYGLRPADAQRLAAELEQRVAPDLCPVPGAAETLRTIQFPVATGDPRQRRHVGRALSTLLDAEGARSTVVLVLSALAAAIGAAVVTARWMNGGSPAEGELTALAVGLLGIALLLPGRGLVDVWRRRLTGERRRVAPDAPWTWHGRWPTGRTEHTALRRMAADGATVGLPFVGAAIAWAGAPTAIVLVPVWAALVALILGPAAVRAWKIAFSGTTEVRATTMPLVPGKRADIRFALGPGAAPFSSIAFRLIRTELRRKYALLPVARYFTTHEGVYHLPPDVPPPGPNEEVAALFDIPADAGGTDEDATPPIRWYVEVRGVTSAGPYVEAFQVPVFDPVEALVDPPVDPPADPPVETPGTPRMTTQRGLRGATGSSGRA